MGLFFESSKNMVSGKVISWKINENEHLGSQKSQRTLHTRSATSDEGIKKNAVGQIISRFHSIVPYLGIL